MLVSVSIFYAQEDIELGKAASFLVGLGGNTTKSPIQQHSVLYCDEDLSLKAKEERGKKQSYHAIRSHTKKPNSKTPYTNDSVGISKLRHGPAPQTMLGRELPADTLEEYYNVLKILYPFSQQYNPRANLTFFEEETNGVGRCLTYEKVMDKEFVRALKQWNNRPTSQNIGKIRSYIKDQKLLWGKAVLNSHNRDLLSIWHEVEKEFWEPK